MLTVFQCKRISGNKKLKNAYKFLNIIFAIIEPENPSVAFTFTGRNLTDVDIIEARENAYK